MAPKLQCFISIKLQFREVYVGPYNSMAPVKRFVEQVTLIGFRWIAMKPLVCMISIIIMYMFQMYFYVVLSPKSCFLGFTWHMMYVAGVKLFSDGSNCFLDN